MDPKVVKIEQFRPQWFRHAAVSIVAIVTLFVIGHRIPMGLIPAIPILVLTLLIYAYLNAGLILSPAGIEWYALHPKFCFRKVPWKAVLGVKRSFWGMGNRINLVVVSGQYECSVWGTPRPGCERTIEIWPN